MRYILLAVLLSSGAIAMTHDEALRVLRQATERTQLLAAEHRAVEQAHKVLGQLVADQIKPEPKETEAPKDK